MTALHTDLPGVQRLRILVLDRSRLLADVLGRRLLAEDDVTAVSVASSAAEALRVITELSFDVVVATPELALEIDAGSPAPNVGRALPVVILADSGDETRARELFRLRAIAGWVSRDRSSEDLMKALRICLRGDAFIPLDVMRLIAEEQADSGPAVQNARERVLAQLTRREVEILLLLEQGLGREDIAAALHLSPNTVRTHVQRILRRLNVHSTLAALALVRD
ncbi:MAG TPA: response regulator transcription factor [Jatrophihabitans sp.]|jgi:DNA-binding NarL/FixJ family response regulator